MQQLSQAGHQAIDDTARRHGFSSEAVTSMLWSVVQGNGSMAQFGHPEFGGSGQWMRGGMTMVSDMFNNALKARVDSLCNELAALVASQPDLVRSSSFQSQSQGGSGGDGQQQSPAGGTASLFVPAAGGSDWWGASLRWPDGTGSQNGVRYAYFSQARRLAIELHGRVTIYDTLDHHIGGFSQQQSGSGTLSFTSQYGLVDVASLPVMSVGWTGARALVGAGGSFGGGSTAAPAASNPASALPQGLDVFGAIDRLAELHARGVLTAEEFSAKKSGAAESALRANHVPYLPGQARHTLHLNPPSNNIGWRKPLALAVILAPRGEPAVVCAGLVQHRQCFTEAAWR